MFGRKRRKARKAREDAEAAEAAEAISALGRDPFLAPPPSHQPSATPEPSPAPPAPESEPEPTASTEAAPADAKERVMSLLTDGERLGFEPELHTPDDADG